MVLEFVSVHKDENQAKDLRLDHFFNHFWRECSSRELYLNRDVAQVILAVFVNCFEWLYVFQVVFLSYFQDRFNFLQHVWLLVIYDEYKPLILASYIKGDSQKRKTIEIDICRLQLVD